jgi:hypothetical protein
LPRIAAGFAIVRAQELRGAGDPLATIAPGALEPRQGRVSAAVLPPRSAMLS